MLMSPSFKRIPAAEGVITIEREGYAGRIILPEAITKRTTYDINIDFQTNSLVFSEGEDVYILTDRFGIMLGKDEEIEANILFVNGGVMLQLVFGKVVLQGENGALYLVDETGDIEYPTGNERIHWVEYGNLYGNVSTVTRYQYGDLSPETTKRYVDNCLFNMYFLYAKTVGEPVFRAKVNEYYTDVALGKVEFVNISEVTNEFDDDDDHIDVSELEDVEEENEFDMDVDDEDSQDF